MEQPTIFYATALVLAVAGLGDGINIWLAWAYVIARILHSLVHATTNVVTLRFGIFLLSSLVLTAMAGHGLYQLLS